MFSEMTTMLAGAVLLVGSSCASTPTPDAPQSPSAAPSAAQMQQPPMAEQRYDPEVLTAIMPPPPLQPATLIPQDEDDEEESVPPNQTVFFRFDSTELSERAERLLIRAARWMSEHPERYVLVEGHAAWSRDERDRTILSTERAEKVRAFLTLQGANENRIIVHGLGASEPTGGPEHFDPRAVFYAVEELDE